MFGGTPGPLRLLNCGARRTGGVAAGVRARERRGGARRKSAAARRCAQRLADRGRRRVRGDGVVFSEAQGIFHPYYVSLLAPFAAALSGAGVAQLRRGGRPARVHGAAGVVAGVSCEVVVLHQYPGQLRVARAGADRRGRRRGARAGRVERSGDQDRGAQLRRRGAADRARRVGGGHARDMRRAGRFPRVGRSRR